MEVTNTNTNQLAPKLGQTASDSFSPDTFSAHLAESDSYASDLADTRADDRRADAEERRAEERQADAEKSAAEDDRRTDEQDRDAEARSEDDAETAEQQNTSGDESEPSLNTAEAGVTDLIDEDATASEETAIISDTEEDAIDETIATVTTDSVRNDAEVTDAPAHTTSKVEDGDTLISAAAADEIADTDTTGDDTDTLTADELALQSAQASNGTATANAEATAGASAQQAVRPAANATASHGQQGTQAITAEDGQGSGLPNPLDPALQSDVDADADGERGLGHQAAEAMAGKSKPSATNTQTPAIQQPAVSSPATPVAPATPLQALASAGLNLSSLPADLNLDLFNLNGPSQTSQAGTPQNSNPVLVRFGALPGQAQATQVPNTAIALQISKHIARGVSTFQIRLDPAEMGRVDVKLELAQDGRVTAHLTVEKAETLDLLQKDAKALEQALKDAGLDADDDTLNFSLKDGSGDAAGGNEPEHAVTGDDQLTTEEDAEDLLLNAVTARQIEAAARGGVDVSI